MAKFFAKLLKIDDFELIILRKKRLGDSDGFCTMVTPTHFVIALARKDLCDPIEKVLAHEMVHVKQFFTGELNVYEGGTEWQGTRFEDGFFNYWEEPWEIEAFGRSVGMAERWFEKCTQKK